MFILRYLFGTALLWLSRKIFVGVLFLMRRLWRWLPI
jgi:hypothetical protein